MTATGQYFSAVRIIILYTVVLTFQSVDNNLSYGSVYRAVQGCCDVCQWVCGWKLSLAIQVTATEQYSPEVLFTTLYKVILTWSLWMKSQSVTIQTKVTEPKYNKLFPVYSKYGFIMVFVIAK